LIQLRLLSGSFSTLSSRAASIICRTDPSMVYRSMSMSGKS